MPAALNKFRPDLRSEGIYVQTPLTEVGSEKAMQIVLSMNKAFRPKPNKPDLREKMLSEAGAFLYKKSPAKPRDWE